MNQNFHLNNNNNGRCMVTFGLSKNSDYHKTEEKQAAKDTTSNLFSKVIREELICPIVRQTLVPEFVIFGYLFHY